MNTNEGSIPHPMNTAIRHGRGTRPACPPSHSSPSAATSSGTPAMATRHPAFARKIRTAVSVVISSASRVSEALSAP